MSSALGQRNWQKRLYRVALVLPLLVGLQLLLALLLIVVGLLPFNLAEISAVQWASVWLGGASATALIALRAFRAPAADTLPRTGDSVLPAAIPVKVTHDCVLLGHGHHFVAVAYLTFVWHWNEKDCRRILETLYQANEAVTLTLARTFDQQVHFHLAVRKTGDTPESAINKAIRTSETLQQALDRHGIEAQRVADALGVEQQYWLCVLGKAFHEDVQLRTEGRLVKARLGANPFRQLATFELQPGTPDEPRLAHELSGLFQLVASHRPFFIVVALKPIPPEAVARQLRELAAWAPETALLAEALGESAVTRAYAESQNSPMAKATVLLVGRKEGLWQTSFRLICALSDAPVLVENLALTPRLLGSRGFAETANMQTRVSGHSLATTSLLALLGQLESWHVRRGDHSTETEVEVGAEAS